MMKSMPVGFRDGVHTITVVAGGGSGVWKEFENGAGLVSRYKITATSENRQLTRKE